MRLKCKFAPGRTLESKMEVRVTPNIFALMGLLSERVPCNLDIFADHWRT